MTAYAYFKGDFVPLADAKIGIMTHAFNYGTGCFEGIRGYWNGADSELYVFKLKEHYTRLATSARILGFTPPASVDELSEITLELLRKNDIRAERLGRLRKEPQRQPPLGHRERIGHDLRKTDWPSGAVNGNGWDQIRQ